MNRLCTRPDRFGGHAKPFILVGGDHGRYRLCGACGKVDDNTGAFAVRAGDVSLVDLAQIRSAAAVAGVDARWAE